MAETKLKALMLKAIDYSESDKLLTLLTAERGRITAKLKGCKSPKAKLRYAASPMSFNEYTLTPFGDKYIITGCDSIDSFSTISGDMGLFGAASIISELLLRFTDEYAGENLLPPALSLMSALCYDGVSGGIVGIKALLDLMRESGYGTDFSLSGEGTSYFSLKDGIMTSIARRDGAEVKVSSSLSKLLLSLDDADISEIKKITSDPQTIKEGLSILDRYFTYQAEYGLRSVKQYIDYYV
jgi:DNA repair protein RecO